MLTVYTGPNNALGGALTGRVGRALAECDDDLFIIVPRQLTLLTERTLIHDLRLRGSFRLRVLSPARLCARIFSLTGAPEGTRVDDRGRVMLVRAALRDVEGDLTVYKSAGRRRGFAEKCAKQIEVFVQGGVTPVELRECAEAEQGADRLRLLDFARIMESVTERMKGRYLDGESELIRATGSVSEAAELLEGRFFFYGFDMMPPTLISLMGAIARQAPVELFFACENDSKARDYDLYLPMRNALERIFRTCGGSRVPVTGEDGRPAELRALTRELYALDKRPFPEATPALRAVYAQNVREECMRVAATARKLAMEGMRWGDMQLILGDAESYRRPLTDAFRLYDVPLFLGTSRAVSRTATAECLIAALRIAEKGWHTEDVFTLLRTGFADADRDEVDRLCNYAIRCGIDTYRWTRPFVRGREEEIEEMEALRRRITAPVVTLGEHLRRATDLKGQLTALYEYLREAGVYQKSAELQHTLIERELYEAAGELAQAWNGIIGAMDQLAELMGDARMPLSELSRTIQDALDAAAVKTLPQSGDAVYAQGALTMLMQPARAVFVLGLADVGGAGNDNLLNGDLQRRVSEHTAAYLGPEARDAARMKRFYLKSALGMTRDFVMLSCPLSGADGGAQRPDSTFAELRGIFPNLQIEGGVRQSEGAQRLLMNAPAAARSMAAAALARAREGEMPNPTEIAAAATLRRLPNLGNRLSALLGKDSGGMIGAEAAKELYGRIQHISVTRLEGFAQCPFQHFVKYGLKPERTEPFELNARDEGTFLHEAVNEFLRRYAPELGSMSDEQAEARMGQIAENQLGTRYSVGTALEDSAAARARGRDLCAAARRCARVLTEHMRGSSFSARYLEQDFGREDGQRGLRARDVLLEGRIDRADLSAKGDTLRIIDFKLGGKPFDLAGLYYGRQLQLPIYLGAAMRRWGARSGGMFYFPLTEGIVSTQSTNPIEIEAERRKNLRMNGLVPADMELLRSEAPEPENVFHISIKKDGSLSAYSACATDADFDRVVNHARRMAERSIDSIRAGDVTVSPSDFGGRMPCDYCDARPACLFDSRHDGKRVRRMPTIPWADVLTRLATEQECEK